MNDTVKIFLDTAITSALHKDSGPAGSIKEWLEVIEKATTIAGILFVAAAAIIGFYWSLLKDRIKEAFDNDANERKAIHALCHSQYEEVLSVILSTEGFYPREKIEELYEKSKELEKLCYHTRTDIANQAFLIRMFLQSYLSHIKTENFHGFKLHRLYVDISRKIEQDCIKLISMPKVWSIAKMAFKGLQGEKPDKSAFKGETFGLHLRDYSLTEDYTLPKGVDFRTYDNSSIDFYKRLLNLNEIDYMYSMFYIFSDPKIMLHLLNEKELAAPINIDLNLPAPFSEYLALFSFDTVRQSGDGINIEEYVDLWYCPNGKSLAFTSQNIKNIPIAPLICKELGIFATFESRKIEISVLKDNFVKIRVRHSIARAEHANKKQLIFDVLRQK